MAESHLSDDLKSWPSDPWAIIGVRREASPAEVKRAYVQLIRRFKPEHHPEHFQKIRAAYEHVERQAKWRAQYEAARDADENDEDQDPDESPLEFLVPASLRDDTNRHAEEESRRSDQSLDDLIDELWQRACHGEEEVAYKGLVDLHYRAAGHVGILLRLYWLRVVKGAVDYQRTPCDWLVDGLVQQGLGGPLWELLRRELEANPAEALTPRTEKLFGARGRPGQWLDLVGWRWHAATLHKRPHIIEEDVRRLRERIVYDDEDTWARVLFHAIDHLAWHFDEPSRMALIRVKHELESLVHLQSSLADDFIRLDLLTQLADDVARLEQTGSSRDWLRLVADSWTRTWRELRQPVAGLVREIAQTPAQSLARLDLLFKSSPAAVSQLGQLIQSYAGENPPADREPRPRATVIKKVLEYVGTSQLGSYRAWRKPLLDFCTYHAIDPLTVAEIYDRSNVAEIGATDLVQKDGPLRFVCVAHRAYWG